MSTTPGESPPQAPTLIQAEQDAALMAMVYDHVADFPEKGITKEDFLKWLVGFCEYDANLAHDAAGETRVMP